MLFSSWFAANPVFAQATRPDEAAERAKAIDAHNAALKAQEQALETLKKEKAVFVDAVGPGKVALKYLGERMEKGPYIGVATSPVPVALRDQLQLRPGIGLVVDHVTLDGPAEKAGLKPSDVVEKLDDQLLVNNQQLAVLVRTHKVGDEVKLSIIRAAKPQVVTVTVGEGDVPPIDELRSDQTIKFNRLIKSNAPMTWYGSGGGGSKAFTFGDFNPILRDRDASFALNWSDKEHDFSITQDAGGRRLVAKDKSGKEIYNGPIDTPAQIEKLPAEIREKLKKLDAKWRQGPATQPASVPKLPAPPPAPKGSGGV
jgi:hypothetical protein